MAGAFLDRMDDAIGGDDRIVPHRRPRMRRQAEDVLAGG
jgi:hypothetical protein